ncbi:Phytoene dehydrogenase-related protein [Rhizobium sp. RU20A]|uniref:phytoene desaturase family protein n=1 Tax=Rhizobium sp. RU20A TaxID=1907412 RepID=UPI0009569AD2|nr:NAD(P)/FAD-dependent oxidoreductase [Rhizobium sp. RU20A]SIQ97897.1 Phytoene dehydrogenase-related protein [Rhizobium sp. RU20A]
MTSSDTPTPAAGTCDVIVIGGGHNGLTAATVLAKAGRSVLLLEAAETLGGATRPYTFHSGFRSPGLAHLLNRLDPEVEKALGLDLTRDAALTPTTVLAPGRPAVTLRGAYGETVKGVTPEEARAFAALRRKLMFQASVLGRFLRKAPPRLDGAHLSDLLTAGGAGLKMLSHGREEARDLLRMLLTNVADVADEFLTDDRLKALLACDATLGFRLGPRSPTSLIGLYYRLTGEIGGKRGGQIPASRVAQAFEAAAHTAGVTIRTGARVAAILTERGAVTGVRLADGTTLAATSVVSALHPRTTFLDLVSPAECDTGLVRALTHYRTDGVTARIDIALDRAPVFPGAPADAATGRIVVARSLGQVEEAFNAVKYGRASEEPALEITVPTLADPDLAPAGRHTLSILAQYAPYRPREGWGTEGPAFVSRVLSLLENVSPGIGATIIAAELLTPDAMEERFDLPGGHWHHGEMQPDQLLVNRPIHALSGYRTPIDGLTLAAAGSHPGGGISGLPGLLAARTLMAGSRP